MREYAAIVDIGSNAVRLVIYDAADRAPIKIHNERHICNLGKGLAATGRLAPENIEKALAAATRFSALIRSMRIRKVRAVATAAVRDAENGAEFLRMVKKRSGLSVAVIDGEEEARLSAAGVMAGGLGRDGVIGDYGGGSLELIAVRGGRIRARTSLPVGSHRLHTLSTRAQRAALVDEHLARAEFLRDFRGEDLCALGGAWRSMARAHMHLAAHPLFVLDHYAVPGPKAARFAALVARQSPASLEKAAGLSRGRVRDVAVAALAMERLLRLLKPGRLVFSASGLREGLLFDALPPAQKRQDPLLAGCRKLARRTARFADDKPFAALEKWIAPLFADAPGDVRRLAGAACRTSDISGLAHEDYQAELAFRRVFVYPFSGADHAARAFLALAAYARYKGYLRRAGRAKNSDEVTAPAQGLLDARGIALALRAGLAMRAGWILTGGALELLRYARWRGGRGGPSLETMKGGGMLATDHVAEIVAGIRETFA